MREWIFAGLLAVSALTIAAGIGWYSTGAGLIAGGVLNTGWAWLVFVYGHEVTPTADSDDVPNYPAPLEAAA